jgi:glycosyltransferase 2 family protein
VTHLRRFGYMVFPPPAEPAVSRNFKITAVLLVTVACLAWVLWGIELEVVRTALGSFRWWYVLPMMGLYLSAHIVRCYRLQILMGTRLGLWPLLTINSIGFLAINVVPMRLGELVRPYLFLEKHDVPFGRSMAAIFVERLLDMVSLLVMLLLVGVVVDIPAGGVEVAGVDLVSAGQTMAGVVSAVGLVFIAAVVVVGEPVIRVVERAIALASVGLAERIAGFLRQFGRGLSTLARTPIKAIAVVVMSAVVWALTVAGLWMVLLGLPGLELGLGEAMVVWALTLAAFTAVPTPGFLGSHEAGCSAALRLLGLNTSLAATVAVIIHAGQLGFTIGLGVLFSAIEGLSLGELVRRSRMAASEPDPGSLTK